MKTAIYQSTYKNEPCLAMESAELRVLVLPQFGGKIQSIFSKKHGREYLYQAPGESFKRPEYGMDFAQGECSGFDDMFPTIDPCPFPGRAGTVVPDHGEVWALPWEWEEREDSLFLSVKGRLFPYHLEKELAFTGPSELTIHYRVLNQGESTFPFIWAAHPLVNCTEGMRIFLPDSAEEIINVYGESKRLGSYGKIYSWPLAQSANGLPHDLSKIRGFSAHSCDKYYVVNQLSEGTCALQDPVSKTAITFTFPVDKVPYLGIWVNEGGFHGQYNAALEPCTGPLDNLELAHRLGKASLVEAGGEYTWFLKVAVEDTE